MNLDAHFARLAELLRHEREDTVAEDAAERARLSLREQVARGRAVADLVPRDERTLGGRPLVVYERAEGGELRARELRPGAIVTLARRGTNDRAGRPDDEAPRGVVSRRGARDVSIALDGTPPDWAVDGGRVALQLEPDATSHARIEAALARMRGDSPEARRWRHALAGEAEPRRGRAAGAGAGAGATTSTAPLTGPGADRNPEQRAAIAMADACARLSLVHGPPGTGKTTTLVAIVQRAVGRGERVLAAAPSNLAADNLVERLEAAGLAPIRVGHPARVLESVQGATLEARVRAHPSAVVAERLFGEARAERREAAKAGARGQHPERRAAWERARTMTNEARALLDAAEDAVLARAQVLVATLTGLEGRAFAGRTFDLAVVDEATQAVEPAIYAALLRAERALLAGDPHQLGPTVRSLRAARGGLGRSLFERLCEAPADATPRAVLAEQHRMHAAIMGYPNEAVYAGRLRAHASVAGHLLAGDAVPLELIDTAGRGFDEEAGAGDDSLRNPGEAGLVVAELERLRAAGVRAADVAVITPYAAQAEAVRDAVAEAGFDVDALEVDTVDGFQGREKEAIVVSLVRSNAEGQVGFLTDVRRMNVALTRARRKLVVVGDGATLASHPFYAGFVAYCERHDAWRSAWERG